MTPMSASFEEIAQIVAMHHGEQQAALVVAFAMRNPVRFLFVVWREQRRRNDPADFNTRELAHVWRRAAGLV